MGRLYGKAESPGEAANLDMPLENGCALPAFRQCSRCGESAHSGAYDDRIEFAHEPTDSCPSSFCTV